MRKKYLLGSILIIFILIFIYSQIRTNSLKKNQAYGIGKIQSINKSYYYKTGRCFKYSFTVNDKTTMNGSCSSYFNRIFKNQYYIDKMMNQKFPVIYNKDDFDSNILIFEDDFAQFNLSFPDSLNWTKDYLKNVK